MYPFWLRLIVVGPAALIVGVDEALSGGFPSLRELALIVVPIVVAVIGYVGVSRARRVDAASSLMTQLQEWNEQLRESEKERRESEAQCRTDLEAARLRMDEMEERHAEQIRELRSALAAEGIDPAGPPI